MCANTNRWVRNFDGHLHVHHCPWSSGMVFVHCRCSRRGNSIIS